MNRSLANYKRQVISNLIHFLDIIQCVTWVNGGIPSLNLHNHRMFRIDF